MTNYFERCSLSFPQAFLGPSRGDVNIMLSNCSGIIICLVAFIHLRIIWKPREYRPKESGAGKLNLREGNRLSPFMLLKYLKHKPKGSKNLPLALWMQFNAHKASGHVNQHSCCSDARRQSKPRFLYSAGPPRSRANHKWDWFDLANKWTPIDGK